ncbi:hypothetical protein [Larkinella soli]|uniref:hypothetical protein n=1 Tax=Larkinella soli TaxID=1770527 RepID=UPI000FFBC012|nr:hypothetical protein [Larkinella soli]
MNSLDKETFSFWVTHPEELIPTDYQQLQEAIGQYPYCQSLYTLAAKAASVHQKGHAIDQVRQAAAFALSRNALRKLIENEFQWSENLLSRLNELSLKHVPIPDDYKKESYELFKRKADQNHSFPSIPLFDFARSGGFDTQSFDEWSARTATKEPEGPASPEPEDRSIVDDLALAETVLQSDLKPAVTEAVPAAAEPAVDPGRQRQMELIDEFIKREPMIQRPRITPNEVAEQEDLTRRAPANPGNVPVTEAFARILIRQGKLDRAIDIYQKLMVKNPEKKVYFADKIDELKEQQQP